MNNFFSNENNAVPNGYIYTSHTGSKYVFLEGLWFNDSNMMLVDPQKYPNMYLSARQQISEHNRSTNNKFKIGATYIHENVECTFIGSNRFQSENGKIFENVKLTELMADDHRVYNVSKDTLHKEWNTLKFYILPPYADDISIPAGMEINGFKFIPKGQRFVNTQTGQAVDPAMTRKLSDDCLRVARQNVSSNTLIPLKSVLVQGNTRAEWNGKDFCDNDGNVIIPEHEVSQIFNAYEQFVKANPQDFPTLTNGGGYQEQRFASVEKPAMPISTKESINEADSTDQVVPDGYEITSNSNKVYVKQNGVWINKESKKQLNSSAAQSVERAAMKKIKSESSAEPAGGDSSSTPEPEPTSSPETNSSSENPKIESLASKIKSSPFVQKIKVLLTRGDKISLMAADILLSGKRDEVVDILKSLNNNDE